MKLTDPEIIEMRKRALENNPRSYEAWYEVLTFGREIEKAVLDKYWRNSQRPVEEGWYVVVIKDDAIEDGGFYVDNLYWSNQRSCFSIMDGGSPHPVEVVRFKKLTEFIEEAGLNPPREEEGSLAHQGVEDGENK